MLIMKKILSIFLALAIVSSLYAGNFDYKYVRTYNANGQVIKEANGLEEWISVVLDETPMLYGTTYILAWGNLYPQGGGDWKYVPAPNYTYSNYNNGWLIFSCSIGFHTDYFYITNNEDRVRTTFLAGGNGCYKEYIRANRPKIDPMGPTR